MNFHGQCVENYPPWRLRCALFVLAFLFLAAAYGAEPAPPTKTAPERLSRVEAGQEAAVILDPRTRTLRFSVVPSHSSQIQAPPLPMTERLKLCEPLFKQFFDQGEKPPYKLLVGQYPEFNRRLAIAAAHSPEWDVKKGAPRKGQPEAFLQRLILEQKLIPELTATFEPLGFTVGIESLESVATCKISEMNLKAKSLAPDDLVPCSAAIVFTLKPK